MPSLRENLGYLRAFAQQVTSGAQQVDGRFRQRVRLYVQSARGVFHETQRRVQAGLGKTEERNVLSGSEHCPGCIDATTQGWVPIGTLAPIGSRECRANCRCRLEFR